MGRLVDESRLRHRVCRSRLHGHRCEVNGGYRNAAEPMSRIELHLCSAPCGARLLVDRDGGGDVLEGPSAAIEDRDFVAPRPTRPPARHDIAELRVYAFASHEAGGEG